MINFALRRPIPNNHKFLQIFSFNYDSESNSPMALSCAKFIRKLNITLFQIQVNVTLTLFWIFNRVKSFDTMSWHLLCINDTWQLLAVCIWLVQGAHPVPRLGLWLAWRLLPMELELWQQNLLVGELQKYQSRNLMCLCYKYFYFHFTYILAEFMYFKIFFSTLLF